MNDSAGTSSAYIGSITVIYTPSKIEQLLDLMASCFDGRVTQEEWRLRFVTEHLTRQFGEPHDTIVILIDGSLADANAPSGIKSISQDECWSRIWNICATAEAMLGILPEECRKFARVTVENSQN